MPFVQRELLGDAERLPGGQYRHLRDRIGVLGERGDERVAGLVDRDRVLLLRQQRVGALPAAEQDPVAGASKSAAVITSRLSRTAKIAASLARLARSAPENPGVPGHDVQVDVGRELLVPAVHARIAARSATSAAGS